ncbi:MAG: peptidoglycan-binding domain-containing protein [Melioribacteraceae bacterium]
MKKMKFLTTLILASGLLFSACSSNQELVDSLQADVSTKTTEISSLKASLDSKESALKSAQASVSAKAAEVEACRKSKADVSSSANVNSDLFPPNAKPGECYARVLIPATYKTNTEKVVKRDASSRLEVIPATYKWGTEKVLVKAASSKLVTVPATYKWGTEKVLVKAASSKLVTVPAKYENKTERILEKAAHTVWKKGGGEIEKVDNATGEIMCLVEVPAQYRTVTSRVQVTPPSTRTIEIPAEYKSVKVKSEATPPSTRTVEIPAEYKTMKVKSEATPPSTRTITIPAEYQTVTKRVKVTEEVMEWRAILCKTNATHAKVMSIQRALKKAGFNPGPIDGVIGSQTKSATKSFQRKKGIAVGGFTQETLKKLGV